jgi:hypothetical protein
MNVILTVTILSFARINNPLEEYPPEEKNPEIP